MEKKKRTIIITVAVILLLLLLSLAIALPLALRDKGETESKDVKVTVTSSYGNKWFVKVGGETAEHQEKPMEFTFAQDQTVIFGCEYSESYNDGGHFNLTDITYDKDAIDLRYGVSGEADFETASTTVIWKDWSDSEESLGTTGYLLLEIKVKDVDAADFSINLSFSYNQGAE